MRCTRLLAPLLALVVMLPAAGCGSNDDPTGPVVSTPATVEGTTFAPSFGIDITAPGWTRTSTGLYYRTLVAAPATAAVAASGQAVNVGYTGYLANGSTFETNSLPFTLGSGQVIAGWDQGIVGMRVGEQRRLLIPSTLGYGARANGPIPANSVLVFDVTLLSTR